MKRRAEPDNHGSSRTKAERRDQRGRNQRKMRVHNAARWQQIQQAQRRASPEP